MPAVQVAGVAPTRLTSYSAGSSLGGHVRHGGVTRCLNDTEEVVEPQHGPLVDDSATQVLDFAIHLKQALRRDAKRLKALRADRGKEDVGRHEAVMQYTRAPCHGANAMPE